MRERTKEVEREAFHTTVFVCTNDRDAEYACCAEVEGEGVYEAAVEWLRDRELYWSAVAVVETGCLGLCSADGVAVAVQPTDRWFSDVTPDDVPELLGTVLGNEEGATAPASD